MVDKNLVTCKCKKDELDYEAIVTNWVENWKKEHDLEMKVENALLKSIKNLDCVSFPFLQAKANILTSIQAEEEAKANWEWLKENDNESIEINNFYLVIYDVIFNGDLTKVVRKYLLCLTEQDAKKFINEMSSEQNSNCILINSEIQLLDLYGA